MKNIYYKIWFLVWILSILILVGCSSPPAAPVGQGNVPTVLVDNATSATFSISRSKPDSVELVYFHAKVVCHCMSVVEDNIKYAVDTYFKDETASGKVKLTMVVSDDSANAAIIKRYDALAFSLFIKETRGKKEVIYPVSDIWNMTGDDNKDKLVNFIKTKIYNVLDGKTS